MKERNFEVTTWIRFMFIIIMTSPNVLFIGTENDYLRHTTNSTIEESGRLQLTSLRREINE